MMKSFLVLGVVLLLLFGCTSPPPAQNTSNNSQNQVAKTPIFSITSPQEGDIITAQDNNDVSLVISTQNLVLKAPGAAPKKGEGHFRVTVDEQDAVIVTSKTYTMSGLSVGDHTVKVQLYNNDRTPYSPSLVRTVHFSIALPLPTVYVPKTYTVTMSDVSYDPVTLTVNVGDSITFVNSGSRPASATAFLVGKEVFNTQVIGPGKSATVTVTQMGQFQYYSLINPIMRGTVIVQADPTN